MSLSNEQFYYRLVRVVEKNAILEPQADLEGVLKKSYRKEYPKGGFSDFYVRFCIDSGYIFREGNKIEIKPKPPSQKQKHEYIRKKTADVIRKKLRGKRKRIVYLSAKEVDKNYTKVIGQAFCKWRKAGVLENYARSPYVKYKVLDLEFFLKK